MDRKLDSVLMSYRSLFLTLIIIFIYFNSSCQANPLYIKSYDLDVNYLPEINSLHITAKAEIEMLSNDNKITLLTNSAIAISSVEMTANGKKENIGYKVIGTDSIGLILPSELITKKVDMIFDYYFKVDSLVGGRAVVYSWYPYLWNNLTKFSIKTKTSSDYIIYIPGNTDKPLPRLNLIIAKKNVFIRRTEKVGKKEINFYFTTADTSLQSKLISESVGSFKYFSNLIGEYPYDELSIYEIHHSDGVYINSQPAFILADERLMIYFFNDQFNWPSHEIAHQWVGSSMFVQHNSPGNSCIFEPLADYLRLMYLEKTKGRTLFDKELAELRSEFNSDYIGTKQDVPLVDAGSSRVTYIKGALVMHLLRNKMGDAKWKDFLNNLFNQYKGIFLTYDNFKEQLRKFGSDYMDKFINWTTTTGIPF